MKRKLIFLFHSYITIVTDGSICLLSTAQHLRSWNLIGHYHSHFPFLIDFHTGFAFYCYIHKTNKKQLKKDRKPLKGTLHNLILKLITISVW